jgi:hypothetical protein
VLAKEGGSPIFVLICIFKPFVGIREKVGRVQV